jgi:molybdate transport system substrate-binding protein
LLASTMANAAEVKIIASNAVKEAYRELLPAYEKASGNKVTVVWGATVDIVKQVENGEHADVIVVSDAGIDQLIKGGKLDPATRVRAAKSSIGVAVREGLPKPDVSTSEGLKKALLGSKTILVSGGLSGDYMLDVFKRLGIADALKPKIKQLTPDRPPGEALGRGEGDIAFTQTSELLPYKGITYIGPLPNDVQLVTLFSLALTRNTASSDAAKKLTAFVSTPSAVTVLKKHGLEPG